MSHSVGSWLKVWVPCHLKLIKVSTSTQGKSWMFRYSMIGAHIIYNMWKNVGQRPTFVMVGESEEKREKTSQVKHKLSEPFFCWINRLECFSETWLERLGIGTLSRPPCSGTIWAKWIYHHPSIHPSWLLIILAKVTLTITLLLYFTLVSKERFHLLAVLIINITDTVINMWVVAISLVFPFTFQPQGWCASPFSWASSRSGS